MKVDSYVQNSHLPYLVLNHRRSLRSQHLDSLEHVDNALVAHPLENDAQSDEDASSTDTSTASQSTQASQLVQLCPSSFYSDVNLHWPRRVLPPGESR